MASGYPVVCVEADGTVGQLEICGNPPPEHWDRSIRRPMSTSARLPTHRRSADIDVLQMSYERFTQRGKMFNGQLIYCAPGYYVVETRQVVLVSHRNVSATHAAIKKIRHDMDAFIAREYDSAIVLDEREGDIPFTPDQIADGLEHMQLARISLRRMVTFKV